MRRLLLLAHRWLGIALTAWVVAVCLTGGVLVYRNELYRHFQPKPLMVAAQGRPLLSDDQLKGAAARAHPGFLAVDVERAEAANQAPRVYLVRETEARLRLFDPYSGADLGEVMPFGYRAVRFMVDLHADLLLGYRGRPINGALSAAFIVIAVSGWIVWAVFPVGRRKKAKRNTGSSNTLRTVHRMVGLWLGVFTLMWAVTGTHLSFPNIASSLVDRFEPLDYDNPQERLGDQISYWFSYAHFGRLGGRIPGCERRSACDHTLKAVWAGAAITPALLAVTGLVAWALRSFRRRRVSGSSPTRPR